MSAPTMRGDIPGAAWPPVFSTRTSALAALALQLDRSQWAAPAAIAEGQARQLRQIATHLAGQLPPVAARLKAAGLDPARIDLATLAHLPPLTRRAVMTGGAALHTPVLPAGHGPTLILQTSGSTGEPVKARKSQLSQLFVRAVTVRQALWHEPDFTSRLCTIRANRSGASEFPTWGGPVSELYATGRSLQMDTNIDLAEQVDRILRFAPATLMIYPTNLEAMLDRLEAIGRELAGVRRLLSVGETLSPETRARGAATLGAEVRDCYSSEEFGTIALECPAGGLYHVMAEALIVEVLHPDGRPAREGEVGELVITDLQNYAMPMIRYAIGDWAEPGPPCPCGRGLPTLRRILGRERNMVATPDGRRYWPRTGFRAFREISPAVVQYQFVQTAIDRLEVRLAVTAPVTPEQQAAIGRAVHEGIGHPFVLDFRYFEGALPRRPNGKFEEFIRLIP